MHVYIDKVWIQIFFINQQQHCVNWLSIPNRHTKYCVNAERVVIQLMIKHVISGATNLFWKYNTIVTYCHCQLILIVRLPFLHKIRQFLLPDFLQPCIYMHKKDSGLNFLNWQRKSCIFIVAVDSLRMMHL